MKQIIRAMIIGGGVLLLLGIIFPVIGYNYRASSNRMENMKSGKGNLPETIVGVALLDKTKFSLQIGVIIAASALICIGIFSERFNNNNK